MMQCNHDCLNCIYDDCINDDAPTASEDVDRFNGNKRLVKSAKSYKTSEKERARALAYYYAHRSTRKAQMAKYGQTEKRKSINKAYYQANKEYCSEYNRQYYLQHREEILKKCREYRRKKKEKQANDT